LLNYRYQAFIMWIRLKSALSRPLG